MYPEYPDRVDEDSMTLVPKKLNPMSLSRKGNNSQSINSTAQANLFRKDRKEYLPPEQIAPVIHQPGLSDLPPPNLKLIGVLLLANKKIAIMEGSFPVREGNQAIRKKPLRRKGYPLGATIGSYKLTKIEKTRVTLSNNRGVVLNINLEQRPAGKVIRKVGNTLVQKNKSFDPGKIKKALRPATFKRPTQRPVKKPTPGRTTRPYRISGAPTPVGTVPTPHVSGR
jgi:hypothetical protein